MKRLAVITITLIALTASAAELTIDSTTHKTFMKSVKAMQKALPKSVVDKLGKAEIGYEDSKGNYKCRNLIESELTFKTAVVKLARSRAVDSDDMYKQIKNVYNENSSSIIASNKLTLIEEEDA